jgi:ATP-binding cassette subfamily B protein
MAILTLILVIPKFRIIQKLVDKLNNVAREHINGIRIVRAHNAEIYQEKKFDKANSELMKTHLFTAKTMSILMPSVDTIMNILILSVYFL